MRDRNKQIMSKRREAHPVDTQSENESAKHEDAKYFENRQKRGGNEDQAFRPDPNAGQGPPEPERRRDNDEN